jgi:hypothetical protein
MYRVFLFLSGGSSSELAICKELAPVASVSPTFNFKSSKSNFIFQRTFFDFTKFLPNFSTFAASGECFWSGFVGRVTSPSTLLTGSWVY